MAWQLLLCQVLTVLCWVNMASWAPLPSVQPGLHQKVWHQVRAWHVQLDLWAVIERRGLHPEHLLPARVLQALRQLWALIMQLALHQELPRQVRALRALLGWEGGRTWIFRIHGIVSSMNMLGRVSQRRPFLGYTNFTRRKTIRVNALSLHEDVWPFSFRMKSCRHGPIWCLADLIAKKLRWKHGNLGESEWFHLFDIAFTDLISEGIFVVKKGQRLCLFCMSSTCQVSVSRL